MKIILTSFLILGLLPSSAFSAYGGFVSKILSTKRLGAEKISLIRSLNEGQRTALKSLLADSAFSHKDRALLAEQLSPDQLDAAITLSVLQIEVVEMLTDEEISLIKSLSFEEYWPLSKMEDHSIADVLSMDEDKSSAIIKLMEQNLGASSVWGLSQKTPLMKFVLEKKVSLASRLMKLSVSALVDLPNDVLGDASSAVTPEEVYETRVFIDRIRISKGLSTQESDALKLEELKSEFKEDLQGLSLSRLLSRKEDILAVERIIGGHLP